MARSQWHADESTLVPMSEAASSNPIPAADPLRLVDVLVDLPPGKEHRVVEFAEEDQYSSWTVRRLPMLLFCNHRLCKRQGVADCNAGSTRVTKPNDWSNDFLTYTCRNCKTVAKWFAIRVCRTEGTSGTAIKLGEWPAFAPYIPPKVRTVLGSDWDMFRQGQRSEAEGLGIGAFSYYRRVVERRKDQLIGEIIKVAEKVKASTEVLDSLKAAAKETQFNKAMQTVKVPESLLINGNNPLTLLHRAISEDLHAGTDQECLENAQAIRHVLVELVQRIDAALKSHDELTGSINRLLQKQTNKKQS